MKRIIIFFIALKVIIAAVMLVSSSLLPYSHEMYDRNFIYPSGESHSIVSSFKAWDAQHYSYLIDKGYHQGALSSAFFPLFPMTASLINLIIQNSVVSGLIIANIASLLMVYFCYRFVQLIASKEIAFLSTALLLVFPTAFQVSLMYSEALFLALVFAFFTYLYQRNYFIASLISLFIPWARPIGILIIIPLIVFFIFDKKKKKTDVVLPSFAEKVTVTLYPQLLSFLFPILGFGLVLLFYKLTTGDFFSSFTIQKSFISHYALENLLTPQIFLDALFKTQLTLHAFTNSIIDRVVFILYLLGLIGIYKKLDKTLFVYALSFGMLPLLGSFMSYSRYVLAVFPLFILLAIMLHRKERQLPSLIVMMFFFAFQVLFSVMYALNYWVS